MKYSEIKICEVAVNDGEMRAIAQPLIKYFKKNCNDEKRINQQLTNLRKNLEKYPEKRPVVIRHLPGVLANLVSKTVYPIRLSGAEVSQIGLDGFSLPLYKREMCATTTDIATATIDGNGVGDGTDGNMAGDANVPGDGDGSANVPGDGDGVASVADTFSSEMGTFEGLIDQSDWDGAIAFLDANPDFEGAIGSTFRSDIQGKIDADAAVERNRIAQEKAEEAEEAAATAAAESQAQEDAEAAEEAQRIAAEEAQARIDAIELEREAEEARIAQEEAEADRLKAEAAAEREAAEKLERERIEAEEEIFDASDWGDDESLRKYPVSELKAARAKYYQNLTRQDVLFFDEVTSNPKQMNSDEQEEYDRLERECRDLIAKYGRGILIIGPNSTSITFTDDN